jgi:hypothetical protein
MAEQSPFEVLGISPDAEPEVIQAAYRALARKYHPDVNQGVPPEQLNARMARINWAKQELERDLAGWRLRVRTTRTEAPRDSRPRSDGPRTESQRERPRTDSGARPQPQPQRRTSTPSRQRRSPVEAVVLAILRPIARTGFRF